MSRSEFQLAALPAMPRDDDGPVFAEPWQAEAFAMAVRLSEAGVFAWTEWAEALGRELAAAGPADAADHYYQHWFAALEKLCDAKGLTSAPERHARRDAWEAAALATPHGEPVRLGGPPRAV